MNKAFGVIIIGAALAFTSLRTARCEISAAETTAIREVEKQQQEAWNRHDAKAYAALFMEDGDCVNVVGWWWKGRPEIGKKLAEAYVYVFRESTLTINEIDVRFLTPELAVVHFRWSMVGARTPKGIPVPQ